MAPRYFSFQRLRAALLILLASAATGVGRAEQSRRDPLGQRFGCAGAYRPWAGEGPLVEIPAGLASAPAPLIGGALALAFVPADLAEMAIRGRGQDEPIPRFARAGLCAGVYIGEGLAWTVGAPFWLLQQALWEAPRKLLFQR